ncbi:MAG: DUF2256 domain-containing protein [Xanthomonadaceae bacterium]|nr:DUF2256 domain-containing protein [Xanthomonadaceae bacterium]
MDPTPAGSRRGHRGNKASLPSKPCAVCGRPMSWRRAWAKHWNEVRYCSAACRRRKTGARRHEPRNAP